MRWGQGQLGARWRATALLGLLAAAPAPLRAHEGWVEFESPAPLERAVDTPWIEVRGRVRERALETPLDLVVAFDLSESSRAPVGFDVDGDGTIGEWRESGLGALRVTDPDDSVAAAGVVAVSSLLVRLDAARTRVGMIRFADYSVQLAPMASVARALEETRALERAHPRGGTNLAAAVDLAVQTIQDAKLEDTKLEDTELEEPRRENGDASTPRPTPGVRRTCVLLVTDGYPTRPGSSAAAWRYARRASAGARSAGVELFGVGLGSGASQPAAAWRELVQSSGGRVLESRDPADWERALAPSRAAGVASIRIDDGAGKSRGRAVRWFEDGSFDAWVSLVPGPNRLRVRAELVDGRVIEDVLRVDYRPSAAVDVGRLLQRLQDRSRAIELQRDVTHAEREPRRSRSLRVTPDEDAPSPRPE